MKKVLVASILALGSFTVSSTANAMGPAPVRAQAATAVPSGVVVAPNATVLVPVIVPVTIARLASATLSISGSFSDSLNGSFGPNTALETDFQYFTLHDHDGGVHASRNFQNGPSSLSVYIGIDWTPEVPAVSSLRVTNPDGTSFTKKCFSGNSCSINLSVQTGTSSFAGNPVPFSKLLSGHYTFKVLYQDGSYKLLEFDAI